MLRAVISELQMQFTQAPRHRNGKKRKLRAKDPETFSQPQDGPVEDSSTPAEGEEE